VERGLSFAEGVQLLRVSHGKHEAKQHTKDTANGKTKENVVEEVPHHETNDCA